MYYYIVYENGIDLQEDLEENAIRVRDLYAHEEDLPLSSAEDVRDALVELGIAQDEEEAESMQRWNPMAVIQVDGEVKRIIEDVYCRALENVKHLGEILEEILKDQLVQ